MNTREATIQGLRAKLEDLAYQYEKTHFMKFLVEYNQTADQILSMGVKPEHLPMIGRIIQHES